MADTESRMSAVIALSDEFEKLTSESVRREVNEDRAAAGFPQVQDVSHVDEELTQRRHMLVLDVVAAIE